MGTRGAHLLIRTCHFPVCSTDRGEGSRLFNDPIPALLWPLLAAIACLRALLCKLGKIITVRASNAKPANSCLTDDGYPEARCLRRAGTSYHLELPTCASPLRPIPNNALLLRLTEVFIKQL